ncbi:MAG: cation:proton antiporter [Kineosporiaceae bacterium]
MAAAGGLIYLSVGAGALAAAWLPRLLDRRPVSMPIVFLGIGALAFGLIPDLHAPDPAVDVHLVERATEVTVLVALFGAGLALDRPLGRHRWGSTWRLLGITMPLTMLVVAVLGHWMLGLGLAAAVLLAAVVAPTDPVLAGDVQVGEPTDDAHSEDEPRFALTSEAGLNDGLAFPGVRLAVGLAAAGLGAGAATQGWAEVLGTWLLVDVAWRVAAGVAVGVAAGRLFARLFFRRLPGGALADRAEGFVALACTFLAYGAAELVAGYGFVAVFACACVIRAAERTHGYHTVLHGFIEQIERLLTAAVLVVLGGMVVDGLLADVRPADVALAALLLVVVRPLTGWVGLLGGRTGPRDRAVIAFFGVRGVGSLYYVAFAGAEAIFAPAELTRVWTVTALVVVGSVVLHGVLATPVMRRLDLARLRAARRRDRRDRVPTVSV